jgi:sortase A
VKAAKQVGRYGVVKKNIPVIAIGCILIIGVCVLLYPVVSAILAKMTQSAVISSYQKAVDNLSAKEIAKMKADAQKYNEKLFGAVLSDPFSGGKNVDTSYVKLLSVGEVMGYLEIQKINVYLPIYHGCSEDVLQKGVGHVENTSLPIGGASTHAALAGHRGLPSATLLTDLDQLVKGDVFYIHILDEVLAYQVDQIKVVEPENTSDLAIKQGEDYVTLVTCTPYGINTQRLLIRGTRIPYAAGHVQSNIKMVSEAAVVPTVSLIIAAVPIVLFVRRKRKVRK